MPAYLKGKRGGVKDPPQIAVLLHGTMTMQPMICEFAQAYAVKSLENIKIVYPGGGDTRIDGRRLAGEP